MGGGWRLPERYGVFPRYIELRMCERLSIDPRMLHTVGAEDMSELLTFELIRQEEEARAGRV